MDLYEKEKSVFIGENFIFLKNQLGEWFGAGQNDVGQLGFGHENNICTLKKIDETFLGNDEIKKFSLGVLCSFLLTKSGKVYFAGIDRNNNVKVKNWIEISGFLKGLKVKELFVGFNMDGSGFYELVNGIFYCIGNNNYGQLGHEKKRITWEPVELNVNFLKKDEKIIDIQLEAEKSFILTDKGNVYCAGNMDAFEEFGEEVCKFREVQFFKEKKVVQIKSTYNFSVFLTAKGNAYGYGATLFGFFGHPKLISIPKKEKIIKIEVSETHLIFLTRKRIFGCGECIRGMGNPDWGEPKAILELSHHMEEIKFSKFLEPRENVYAIVDAYAANNTLFFKNEIGQIFVSGLNEFGECCLGHFQDPKKELQKIKGIFLPNKIRSSSVKHLVYSNQKKNKLSDLIIFTKH